MKKNLVIAFTFLLIAQLGWAQTNPEIVSWIRNTNGAVGYNNIPSNVQIVQYSANNVYISCTCIPGYSIGPWMNNPNTPINKNFVYKITRNPVQNTGTLTNIGLGHTGVWTNGVSIFNADDGQTYMMQGVWHRNAYFFEGPSFDNCLGHPAPGGEYHHHVNPQCLYNPADSSVHSPIIGYAFDGFPVYGAWGYTNANGTGPLKRMTPSYQVRNMTDRTTLPNGTTAPSPGPAINTQYPLGAFIQDYEYLAASGDLDEHNGRFCVTPEYPLGTYAYFVTIDAALLPVFPFTMTETYYGVVQAGNTGPNGGHVTINETTTIFNGNTAVNELNTDIKFEITPNPVKDYAFIYFDPSSANNIKGEIYNAKGQLVYTQDNLQPSISYGFDFTTYPSGNYFLHLTSANKTTTYKIVKVK
nr:YHYH protein [Bacteroidota bacterium]